eukprot:CAMPEP_0195614512 /NCGR_PEP_ID=MMETSP0815-20121206/11979_1 /TAXON_ID=97485 /ORGANISM="Prymnesium parvum, Strain Texoma1" /LENGTH=206 /DNA_ID=CAMNT_0040754767 /DNA_START=163 /DNA_END=780 /DNA_ORIENTATION=+
MARKRGGVKAAKAIVLLAGSCLHALPIQAVGAMEHAMRLKTLQAGSCLHALLHHQPECLAWQRAAHQPAGPNHFIQRHGRLGSRRARGCRVSRGEDGASAGNTAAAAAAIPVKAVAVPVEAGSACVSELKVDVPTAQCQTFCNALFKKHHCKWCKCRACAFCAEGTPPAENNTATTSPPPPSPSPTPSPAESNASLDLHANPLALE